MKNKNLFRFNLILILLTFLAFVASGIDSQNNFENQLEASGANELFDVLTDDDVELLHELGIDKLDYETLFSPSLRSIFDFFFQIVRNELSSPSESFFVLATIVITVSAVSSLVQPSGKTGKTVELVSGVLVSLVVIIDLSLCITRAVSAMNVTSRFVLALIPVLASVIAVSGNPALAFTYNSMSFAAAQFVSEIGDGFIRPFIQTVMSLSVISSVSNSVNISRIIELARKTLVFAMSFISTVFVTVLSLKGMLAASADNVTVRGIRFLIGNMIPVVGGAVSDAYSSVAGTLALVKNTIGVFAFAAVGVINIPVLIECVIRLMLLNILSVLSDMFSLSSLSALFKAVSSSFVLLVVAVIFEMLVFVLSVGLIMVIKGS